MASKATIAAAVGAGALAIGAVLFWPRRAAAGGRGLTLNVEPGRVRNLAAYAADIRRESNSASVLPLQVGAHIMVESGGAPNAIRVEVEGVLESDARRALQREANADPVAFMDRFDRGELAGQARTASVGLMQLLPATAREVGFTGSSRDLFVPEVNIRFGARYIGRQLRRYGGVARDAAAAYNAGSVKLANPYVAGQLIVKAMEARISPCALVRSPRGATAQAIVAAVGGYFETATDQGSAQTLRAAGKNVWCNQEYVDSIAAWAVAIRDQLPELGGDAEGLAGGVVLDPA